MAEESAIPYLREILVFLGAAVLIVPLFHRLKVSPILGYLAVGVIIGPFGLKFISDVEGVRRLAELGVVFLLFSIGIELSLKRLWSMRRLVFGLGTAQVLVTGAVVTGLAYLWGAPHPEAVVLGTAFALSSTAMVMQLLVERGEIASSHGRVAFAILLMQDLAVVPAIFLLNILGAPNGQEGVTQALIIALAKGLAAVVLIIIVGRVIIRPLFRIIAGTRSSELFIALTLLGILGLSFATGAVGLSTAMGAFLAGLLVAETEFRPQVEADIRPFRGLLLGLFFISVGMSINLETAAHYALWMPGAVIGLIVLKAVIIATLTRLFGRPWREAVRAGILLGQAGEFAFILIGAALAMRLMPDSTAQFMAVVVGLSMVVTPFLPKLGDRVAALLPKPEEDVGLPMPEGDLEGHVIIAGFGRVGRTIARLLAAQKVSYIVLETDPDIVRQYREHPEPVYFGNPAQEHVLERVGADKAQAIVITVNDSRAAGHILRRVRQHWPDIPVYARSRDITHSEELMSIGATAVVPETEESSLQLGARVLSAIGFPADAINQCLDSARSEIYGQAPKD